MTTKVLLFTTLMFLIGCFGMMISQYHLIVILLSLELMLLAANINFVIFSMLSDDLVGQIYAILVLGVAAAETAIGLALLVVYYRLRGSISIDLISLIKA